MVMAQSETDRWAGFFSYNNIKDVAYADNKVYVAAENAVYTYDIWDESLSTITTIDGLSGESITQIHYSDQFQVLLIGHDNGLIELVPQGQDDVIQINQSLL